MKKINWQELGLSWQELGLSGPKDESYSVLDAQCVIRGDITTTGTLRVDGRLEGDILRGDLIIVGAGASVAGNITAREVVVGGSVSGRIVAEQRVEIEAGADIVGDIESDHILMHEGACVSGHLSVRPRAQRATLVRDAAAALPVSSELADLVMTPPKAPPLVVLSRDA